MQVISLIDQNHTDVIKLAGAVLARGGLIVYPTETCYGLGADATNKKAIDLVYAYKGNRQGKPISIAVADQHMAQKYVSINQTALNIYKHFLPGPVTVISRSLSQVDPRLESLNHTLGIRIPGYPFILQLLKSFNCPVTATSANTSGQKNPYSLADFKKYTSLTKIKFIDLFIDAGVLPERLTSTVVDTTLNEPSVLRQGEIIIPDTPGQVFITDSEAATIDIAKNLLPNLRKNFSAKPLIFALQGELGAGKTRFAKGIAQALGITEIITSPTFTIINEYPYKKGKFIHIDTWRLERGEELSELGLAEMLQKNNVLVIEWMQKVKPILEKIAAARQAQIIWVTIDYLSLTKRKIKYLL